MDKKEGKQRSYVKSMNYGEDFVEIKISHEPNQIKQAIVKSVKCVKISDNEYQLHIETEDGLSTPNKGWFMKTDCRIHQEKFGKTYKDVLLGAIKEGTEVIVEYNANGIMQFYLENLSEGEQC